MGSGTYVGRLLKLDEYEIVISQLDYDGKPYRSFDMEEQSWNWSGPKTALKAMKLDLIPGDRVEVEVEFDSYKATSVEPFDWNPRRLHERLERIEKHLELE